MEGSLTRLSDALLLQTVGRGATSRGLGGWQRGMTRRVERRAVARPLGRALLHMLSLYSRSRIQSSTSRTPRSVPPGRQASRTLP